MDAPARKPRETRPASSRRRSLTDYPLRRKVLLLSLVLILAGSGLNAMFGDRGLYGLMRTRQNLRALQAEVRTLEETNRGLMDEIQALRHDPMAVERRAREVLGMVRPGELVLTVREPE